MRKLGIEKRALVLNSLVEGNSIASTCRMLGVNKVTVLRLLADAGTFAAQLHDLLVQDVECDQVQLDEIWSFTHSKNANVRPENWTKRHGDTWTWVFSRSQFKTCHQLACGWPRHHVWPCICSRLG